MQAGGLGRSSAEENKMMSERDLEKKGKWVGIGLRSFLTVA